MKELKLKDSYIDGRNVTADIDGIHQTTKSIVDVLKDFDKRIKALEEAVIEHHLLGTTKEELLGELRDIIGADGQQSNKQSP